MLVKLRGIYPTLTAAERRVADYVIAATAEVVQEGIAEVARHSEVGVGTVGRLCTKLGFSGFPALKIALATDFTSDDAKVGGLVEVGDLPETILHKTTQLAEHNLHDTASLVNVSALSRAIARLRTASLVTLYATSQVDHALAQMFAQRLMQLDIANRTLIHADQQTLHLSRMAASEALVILSASGEAPGVISALERFGGQDHFVLLLTCTLGSPLSRHVTVELVAAARPSGAVLADAAYYTGLFHLVEILYSTLAVSQPQEDARMVSRRPQARVLDSLRIAVPYLPETMDPQQVLGIANGRVFPLVFSTLINRDWTGSDWKLIPSLAASWQRLDERTLELSLRADVRWHDGVPFTPEDVVFTFSRIQSRDPGLHVARSNFWALDRVEQTGPNRVCITTAEPDPHLEMRLASHHVAYILPAHHHTSVGAQAFSAGDIVGTGPYRLESWPSENILTFTWNERYFGGRPAARHLEIINEPEPSARTAGLLAGDFDLITDVPPDQKAIIAQQRGFRTRSEIIGLDYELLFNMQAPPVDRREIRRGLSLAVDRQRIIDDIWQGFAVHPRGSQIPGETFYDPNRPHAIYDPSRARELLERGGYNGETIRFASFSPDYYILDQAMVNAIAQMWREIGITVEIETFSPLKDRSRLMQRGNTHHHVFEMATGSYNDLPQRLVGMWGRDSDFQQRGFWMPESAQRYNDLIEDLSRTTDVSERQAIYHKLLDELEYEVPGTPVLIPELIYAMRGHIDIAPNNYQGLDLTPANFQLLDGGDARRA